MLILTRRWDGVFQQRDEGKRDQRWNVFSAEKFYRTINSEMVMERRCRKGEPQLILGLKPVTSPDEVVNQIHQSSKELFFSPCCPVTDTSLHQSGPSGPTDDPHLQHHAAPRSTYPSDHSSRTTLRFIHNPTNIKNSASCCTPSWTSRPGSPHSPSSTSKPRST